MKGSQLYTLVASLQPSVKLCNIRSTNFWKFVLVSTF